MVQQSKEDSQKQTNQIVDAIRTSSQDIIFAIKGVERGQERILESQENMAKTIAEAQQRSLESQEKTLQAIKHQTDVMQKSMVSRIEAIEKRLEKAGF